MQESSEHNVTRFKKKLDFSDDSLTKTGMLCLDIYFISHKAVLLIFKTYDFCVCNNFQYHLRKFLFLFSDPKGRSLASPDVSLGDESKVDEHVLPRTPGIAVGESEEILAGEFIVKPL